MPNIALQEKEEEEIKFVLHCIAFINLCPVPLEKNENWEKKKKYDFLGKWFEERRGEGGVRGEKVEKFMNCWQKKLFRVIGLQQKQTLQIETLNGISLAMVVSSNNTRKVRG